MTYLQLLKRPWSSDKKGNNDSQILLGDFVVTKGHGGKYLLIFPLLLAHKKHFEFNAVGHNKIYYTSYC